MIDEIGPDELEARIARGEPIRFIDVRQPWEHEIARLPGSELVPLDRLASGEAEVEPGAPDELVVVYCHHGVRSLTGVALLQRRLPGAKLVSLAGGIDLWSELVDPSVPRY